MMGTFVDPRDGQTYKTVEINGQIWLAENLRYEGVRHYAPNGDKDTVAKYGCLYTWENALKACPDGWHLPSKKEFEDLLKATGATGIECSEKLRVPEWRGVDAIGFRALPSGYYDGVIYHRFGYCTYFWSDMEADTECAYGLFLDHGVTGVIDVNKDNVFSVRCIKD